MFSLASKRPPPGAVASASAPRRGGRAASRLADGSPPAPCGGGRLPSPLWLRRTASPCFCSRRLMSPAALSRLQATALSGGRVGVGSASGRASRFAARGRVPPAPCRGRSSPVAPWASPYCIAVLLLPALDVACCSFSPPSAALSGVASASAPRRGGRAASRLGGRSPPAPSGGGRLPSPLGLRRTASPLCRPARCRLRAVGVGSLAVPPARRAASPGPLAGRGVAGGPGVVRGRDSG